jgi:endonuclease-3
MIDWIGERFYREEDNWSEDLSPFEVLIATILSQATSDRNSHHAFRLLKGRFDLSPKVLSRAPISVIEEAIRVGGLHHQKALKIKAVSKALLGRDLAEMMGSDDGREQLLALPGVGEKTADVLLCLKGGKDVVPIDTHIKRISSRVWGFTGGYDEVQSELHKLIEPKRRKKTHIAMIRFGREICKAREPLCEICEIKGVCLYFKESRGKSKKGQTAQC